jgi:hypothetical protein
MKVGAWAAHPSFRLAASARPERRFGFIDLFGFSWLHGDVSPRRQASNLAKYFAPAAKMILDRSHSHVCDGSGPAESECLNKGVALPGTEQPPRGFQFIYERGQEPLGQLSWVRQPLPEIYLVLCDNRKLKAAHLEHPDFAVGLGDKKLAEFG